MDRRRRRQPLQLLDSQAVAMDQVSPSYSHAP